MLKIKKKIDMLKLLKIQYITKKLNFNIIISNNNKILFIYLFK